MTTTSIRVEELAPIGRQEAPALARTEYERMEALLRSLDESDWTKPTDCELWDVRAMAGHVVGMTRAFTGARELMRQMRAGKRAAADGPFIDGLTAVQVREQAGLSSGELVERLTTLAPRATRFRARVPAPLRRMPMKEEVDGQPETWKFGYLLDVILTRDAWMHRVDITRAADRRLVLTSEHDGRIVADIVAEWARRHGRPFTLTLEGPAGGVYAHGEGGGDALHLDAVEFCRIVSGRERGAGLLAAAVPF
jgi:uncharacterized protein (TIGR03083 family)